MCGLVNIMSVFKEKLLVSCRWSSKLFVYSIEGCYLLNMTTIDNDQLLDATWTPRGNIIYTTEHNIRVVILSEFGEVILTQAQSLEPQYNSV